MSEANGRQPKPVGEIHLVLLDNGELAVKNTLSPTATLKVLGVAMNKFAEDFAKKEQMTVKPAPPDLIIQR